MKYNILDLFAGCGGLSQGFRELNKFNVPYANEFWKPAYESYKLSHKDTKVLIEDIKSLTNEKLSTIMKEDKIKKIDIIIGGPPCQGFSMAGSRNIDDPRNRLFLEFVRIVDFLAPSFFIFENVKGLLSMKNKNNKLVIEEIVAAFKSVDGGYELQYKVLNSADYGVPQKRERIILIGSNLKIKNKLFHPTPTHAPKDNLKEIKLWFRRNGQYFFNLSDKELTEINSTKDLKKLPIFANNILNKMNDWEKAENYLKDLINLKDKDDIFNHKPMNHTDIVVKRMSLIKEGKNIPSDQSNWPKELRRKKFASVYKRISRNEPTCTMVPGHSAFPIHYKLNRSLTVREAARIQTLPDSFKFVGSKTEQCLVVGNAVPSKMAKEIGKNILNLLVN
jgi:DNA (cytosine-5)-methyltransferase 1